MRVIVTGGAGFIGSNLASELSKDHDVIVVDGFSTGDFKNLATFSGTTFAEDIREIDWERYAPEAIFHEAAITDTRVTDQKKVMEVNVNAFKRLLDYACKNNVKIVYASSAAVYGNNKAPMKESDCPSPLNVYGFSKLMMDNLAATYIKRYPKASIIGLRYFNVFGPNEDHKKGYSSMIHQIYNQVKEGKKPKLFFDGSQTRDHVYVKDVVQANLAALAHDGSGVFNVGIGKETSFNEILKHLGETLGKKIVAEWIDNPYSFYQNRTCADISKLKKIGYSPRYTVKQGIEDYFGKQ